MHEAENLSIHPARAAAHLLTRDEAPADRRQHRHDQTPPGADRAGPPAGSALEASKTSLAAATKS